MLSKTEIKLLKIINDNANEQGVTLISLMAILVFLDCKNLANFNVKKALILLMQNDYLDVTFIEKNNEEYCLVTLKNKGKNYKVEKENVYRQFKTKLLLAFIGAIVSFLVGKILYFIFS